MPMAIYSETNIRRQTALFCLVDFAYVLTQQFVLNEVKKTMPGYGTWNLLILLSYPFLTVLFIRMIRLKKRMPFPKKILPVICLVMCNFLSIVMINLINPFNRTMTIDDVVEGISKGLIFHVLVMLPLSLILALITRTRIIETDDLMDRIHDIK